MLVVAAIVVGLAALLAVPLEVAFELDRVEALAGQVSFRWLFGLVRVRLAVPRPRPSRPEAAVRKPARARPASGAGGGAARGLAVLRDGAFRQRVLRYVGELADAVDLRGLRLHARLGLGDPAETGYLWALVGPLGAVVGSLRGAEVRIEPDFLDAVLELHSRGRVRFIPLRLLALSLCFALSPPSIHAWRTWRGHA